MDLAVGAYEDISSADVTGIGDALAGAMPGLVEHRCSIGERGGFLTRLRRGTYAPHIIEHVALELQNMIGHDVGYGRTRGGDVPSEYTLVFEHRHELVGLRAAALALETVQRAFAGTLTSVGAAVDELRALAATPDTPPVRQHVMCAITGGTLRDESRREMLRLGVCRDDLLVDVSPAHILQAGLPFSRAELAVVTDTALDDVPPRYREPERAARLVSVVAEAMSRNGVVLCPAKAWEVQDFVRDAGARVAIFAEDDDVSRRDKKVAVAVAMVQGGHVLLEHGGDLHDAGPPRDEVPVRAQVIGVLAAFAMEALLTDLRPQHAGT
jgi:cyanophycin synthetase